MHASLLQRLSKCKPKKDATPKEVGAAKELLTTIHKVASAFVRENSECEDKTSLVASVAQIEGLRHVVNAVGVESVSDVGALKSVVDSIVASKTSFDDDKKLTRACD